MEIHQVRQEYFLLKRTQITVRMSLERGGYLGRACMGRMPETNDVSLFYWAGKKFRTEIYKSCVSTLLCGPITFLARNASFWSWVCLVLSWGKCRWRVALPAGNGQSLWWQITYRVSVWQTESTKGNYSPHTIQIHPTTRIRYSVCLFSTFLTDGGYPSARTYLRNQTVKGVLPPSLQN